MFMINLFDEKTILVHAYSFELTAGHVVFYDDAGKKIGFYNKEIVKSVFKSDTPEIIE